MRSYIGSSNWSFFVTITDNYTLYCRIQSIEKRRNNLWKQIESTLVTMPVGRLLLKFSLPAIAGMIINSLYNLVDRIFVGRIGGLAMTGIGLSLSFMLMLSAVSSMIGIGASALISIKFFFMFLEGNRHCIE